MRMLPLIPKLKMMLVLPVDRPLLKVGAPYNLMGNVTALRSFSPLFFREGLQADGVVK